MTKRNYSKRSRGVEANILGVYSRASGDEQHIGMVWYAQTNYEAQIIADKYGVVDRQAIGVIAAISPGLEWGRNLVEAAEMIAAFKAGDEIPPVGVYGRGNVEKAQRILRGEDPLDVFPEKTSPKVRSFYSNILNPRESTEVTVDRHAKALAYNFFSERSGFASNDKLSVVRPAEYKFLEWHYRKLAERLGLIPNQLQAICWVTWKRLGASKESEEVPF